MTFEWNFKLAVVFLEQELLVPSVTDNLAMSTAITEITEKFFIEKSIRFGILVYGGTTYHLSDVISGFLDRMNKNKYPVYLKHSWGRHLSIDCPLIVFMRNKMSLESFINAAKLNNELHSDMKILIYLDEDIRILPSHQKFILDSTNLLDHCYYILNELNHVVFLTMEYFNQHSCNRPEPGIIDVYHKRSMRWEAQLLDYDIYQNFFGCELVLVENFGPYFNYKNKNQDIIDCLVNNHPFCAHIMYYISQDEQPQGLAVDLFEMTSKSANLTPIFKLRLPTDIEKFYNIKEQYPVIQLTIGSLYKDIGYPTPFIMESNYIIAATPSDFYTNYEKLWLPFDDQTWSLVELFEFMTTDMRKPPPSTIEDLIERNYKILTCDQGDLDELVEILHGKDVWKNVQIFNDCSQIFTIYCSTFDNSSAKLAFFIDNGQYSTYASMCHGTAIELRNFKSDTSLITLFTTHRSIIHKHLSATLDKVIPAGIPQYLFDYYKSLLFKKFDRIEDKSPKVLAVDDLGFGFVLWLCACGISVVGFLLELMTLRMRMSIHNFVGVFGILEVLKWYLRIRA
ncbi:unnamed protein product [Chironomus riparius]|uniref:Uncharacterized protein n=1 Tax=Chironomus riparius TaxID=315576 RepID=A0A9N9S377_9DIPT|nr:unnamed protein product [Chironomus riparius]